MKKIFLTLVLICLIPLHAQAIMPGLLHIWGSAPTNYINDANCMFAAYMNSAADATETDRSTHGNNLTETTSDTVAQSSTVPTNYLGYSKDFEFDDQECLYHADSLETDITGGALTLAAWVYAEDDNSFNQVVIGKSELNKRQYVLYFSDGDAGYAFLISPDGTDANQVIALGATSIAYGAWMHVAAVYNGTDMRIYINGQLDSNSTDNPKAYTGDITNTSALFRVGGTVGTAGWDGLVDEAIVFNRSLSADEINEIYTYGIDGTGGDND